MNAHRYPVWASLAGDFLSIMASSVSSERAFLAAGITISKRRNSLKPVTVEALQCLKGMYRHNLIFREYLSSASAEGVQEEEGGGVDGPAAPDDPFDLASDSDCDVDTL